MKYTSSRVPTITFAFSILFTFSFGFSYFPRHFSSDMSPHTWIYYAKISEKLVPGVSGSNPSVIILTKCYRFKLDYNFLVLFLTKTYFPLDLVIELAKNQKLFKKVSISGL